jgi:hypothetical protein
MWYIKYHIPAKPGQAEWRKFSHSSAKCKLGSLIKHTGTAHSILQRSPPHSADNGDRSSAKRKKAAPVAQTISSHRQREPICARKQKVSCDPHRPASPKRNNSSAHQPTSNIQQSQTWWCDDVAMMWCNVMRFHVMMWWCDVVIWWCGDAVMWWCGDVVMWRGVWCGVWCGVW